MSAFVCAGCGVDIRENDDVVLTRINPKGQGFVGKCEICLNEAKGSEPSALVRAIVGPA